MSDIVVRGMEMPKSCFKGVHDHCPFYADCTALKRFCDNHSNLEIVNTIFTIRMEDCPLVRLPPHGDLKDTDAIVNTIKETFCKGCNNYGGVKCRACLMDDCLACIDDTPTILEASE